MTRHCELYLWGPQSSITWGFPGNFDHVKFGKHWWHQALSGAPLPSRGATCDKHGFLVEQVSSPWVPSEGSDLTAPSALLSRTKCRPTTGPALQRTAPAGHCVQKEKGCQGLAHVVMEDEKSCHLPQTSMRPRTAGGGGVQTETRGLTPGELAGQRPIGGPEKRR